MSATFSAILPLPAHFHQENILKFHRRDKEGTAERVEDARLQKGILWQNCPACLTISFQPKEAEITLDIDGNTVIDSQAVLAMAARMLGLNQSVEVFEAKYKQHPQIGKIVTQQAGLRVPAATTPFEALVWAVTGQQISVAAAISIRRRLILTINKQHSSGLYCHPDAAVLAALDEEALRTAGYSRTKIQTLKTISEQLINNKLPLNDWLNEKTLPIETMRKQLSSIHGIGPWTINYALLRGYGWLDGSLHGDAGVRRGLQKLLSASEKISEKETQAWLLPFSPWRSLVAAHLWKYTASGETG